jgi:hypothetical protein
MDIDFLHLLEKAANPYKRAVLYIIMFVLVLSTCYAASAFVYRSFTTTDYRRRRHLRLVNFMTRLESLSSLQIFLHILNIISSLIDRLYGRPVDDKGNFASFFTARAFKMSAILTCIYLALSTGTYPQNLIMTVDDYLLTIIYFIIAYYLWRHLAGDLHIKGVIACAIIGVVIFPVITILDALDDFFSTKLIDDQLIVMIAIIIPLFLINRISLYLIRILIFLFYEAMLISSMSGPLLTLILKCLATFGLFRFDPRSVAELLDVQWASLTAATASYTRRYCHISGGHWGFARQSGLSAQCFV